MKLYEIDAEIMACVDPETGEIIDPEKLEQLQLERDFKIEGVALWVKNLKSDLNELEAERKAFQEREKQTKAKIENLSKWLTRALNGENFQTSKIAISFRSSEAVEITDESAIPKNYIRKKVELVPDKMAIKIALKSNSDVPGAALIQNKNIQIK